MRRFALLGALGALSYMFHPDKGASRRKLLTDRFGGLFGGGKSSQPTQSLAPTSDTQDREQPDDVTLAHKVETEIFRASDVPKGQINVNAEDGVVYLRGEVEERDLIADLERQAKAVQGVMGVENLLHVPGEEAPAKPE